MEELFVRVTSGIALFLEVCAALIIFVGGIEAVVGTIVHFLTPGRSLVRRKQIWVRFAVWLLLGLEFTLAADIVRTAISPSWTSIGQLAAIAAIRTFLNYFLERDIEKAAI